MTMSSHASGIRAAASAVVAALALVAAGASAQEAGAGKPAGREAAAGPAARFQAAAPRALETMIKEAEARGMKGVAVVAFVPGDTTRAWTSQMKAVDAIVLGNANVLAIAYCKLAEMADTLQDSGSQVRPPLHGELGYRGGAYRKTDGGFFLAAFSGGKDTDDLDVSRKGLDVLEKPAEAKAAAE